MLNHVQKNMDSTRDDGADKTLVSWQVERFKGSVVLWKTEIREGDLWRSGSPTKLGPIPVLH